MKKLFSLITVTALASTLMLSSVYATEIETPELPKTMTVDGRVFELDESYDGKNTATPDNEKMTRAYSVLGSDVALYIDYSHGHGGDHFAAGWVQATAPSFTARAEVWANGSMHTTGQNMRNVGNIANAASYLSTGISSSNSPRLFYAW